MNIVKEQTWAICGSRIGLRMLQRGSRYTVVALFDDQVVTRMPGGAPRAAPATRDGLSYVAFKWVARRIADEKFAQAEQRLHGLDPDVPVAVVDAAELLRPDGEPQPDGRA